MHLVQGLLQAILLAGIDTDGLQGLQLGCNALLKKVLNREGIPDALLTLLDGTLVILKDMCMLQSGLGETAARASSLSSPHGIKGTGDGYRRHV
jgi:hypothetical protein